MSLGDTRPRPTRAALPVNVSDSSAIDRAERLLLDKRPSIRRSLVIWLIVPLALLVPATAHYDEVDKVAEMLG